MSVPTSGRSGPLYTARVAGDLLAVSTTDASKLARYTRAGTCNICAFG